MKPYQNQFDEQTIHELIEKNVQLNERLRLLKQIEKQMLDASEAGQPSEYGIGPCAEESLAKET